MRVLVTAALTSDERDLDELRRLGHEVTWVADETAPLPPEALDAEGVICNALFLHHDIALFPHLRVVQLTSAGLDRVPVDRLRERGIRVHNAAGIYSIPLAEWVVLQILQLSKRSRLFARQQDNHQWLKQRDLRELAGRTACIVGFGSVGREVATRLRAFDVRIIAVDTTPPDVGLADESFTPDTLHTALAAADIVVLSVPLTPTTRHLVDSGAIAAMKPDAMLVNVSRGAVLDERALVQALGQGRFFGVALDVFEAEPLPEDSALWDFERVLVTPHNAFVSDHVKDRLLDLVVRNLGGD